MSYQEKSVAKDYIEFTNSENGQIQQEVVGSAFSKHLRPGMAILDAGCGGGWLTAKLAKESFNVVGCDFSDELISYARETYPEAKFDVADVTKKLPYSDAQFDTVIFNMSGHDVSDLGAAFGELSRVTKTGGLLLMTIANPYYAFPVGVWKRGLIGVIRKRMPKLVLRPYFEFARSASRQFTWNHQFPSYFYTLPEYIEHASDTNFTLTHLKDLECKTTSDTFNMRYRLFHFPMIQLLVFKKASK